MTWEYDQKTGALTHNGVYETTGYSGNGEDMNNPLSQELVGHGPLPRGTYTIGPPHEPVDHLGPYALPLWPNKDNEMFGRSGFFIHGDNAKMNHTASDGCIIVGPSVRTGIVASKDDVLVVMASEEIEAKWKLITLNTIYERLVQMSTTLSAQLTAEETAILGQLGQVSTDLTTVSNDVGSLVAQLQPGTQITQDQITALQNASASLQTIDTGLQAAATVANGALAGGTPVGATGVTGP